MEVAPRRACRHHTAPTVAFEDRVAMTRPGVPFGGNMAEQALEPLPGDVRGFGEGGDGGAQQRHHGRRSHALGSSVVPPSRHRGSGHGPATSSAAGCAASPSAAIASAASHTANSSPATRRASSTACCHATRTRRGQGMWRGTAGSPSMASSSGGTAAGPVAAAAVWPVVLSRFASSRTVMPCARALRSHPRTPARHTSDTSGASPDGAARGEALHPAARERS